MLRARCRFDVALEQGLGEVVVDYVAELCSDPFQTSADPVEAYLMDGRCVQQWASRALHRTRARFLQVPPLALACCGVPPADLRKGALAIAAAPCMCGSTRVASAARLLQRQLGSGRRLHQASRSQRQVAFFQGLQQGLASEGAARVVASEAGRLHALALVLQPLASAEHQPG